MSAPSQLDPRPAGAPRTSFQRAARPLLVVYLVVLLLAVLTPTSTVQSGLVLDAQRWLVTGGVPQRLATFDRLEMLANVVIVVPVGLLGALAFLRTRWQSWTAYAFLGALAVELVQGFLLPARQAATSDVVANTLGALVGAALARGVTAALAARRR